MVNQNDMEIDLLEIARYLRKRILVIIAAAFCCAVAGYLVSTLLMTPKYTASTQVYILNRSGGSSVVSSDFALSNYMVNDYQVLITGQNVTKEVIRQLGLSMCPGELSERIAVTAPDNTRVLQISVTDVDPERAARIANSVREVAAEQIRSIMDVDAVNLVYAADVPGEPSSPDVMRNTLLAAAVGLIAAIAVLAAVALMDDTIRTEEDVERYLGLSTLGVIPACAELNTMGDSMGTRRNRVRFKKNRMHGTKK